MKWPVHDHDLYDRKPSQHTEEQLLVSLVTAFSSSSISFASLLFTNKLSFSHHASFQLMSLSYVCFHPTNVLFFFHQHNSLQFVLIWQIVSRCHFLLSSSTEASFQDMHSGEKLPVSFLIHFFFPNFSINSSHTRCILFFFQQTSTATFAIQYHFPVFFPQEITTMVSQVTTPHPKLCHSKYVKMDTSMQLVCGKIYFQIIVQNKQKHILCIEVNLLTQWTFSWLCNRNEVKESIIRKW